MFTNGGTHADDHVTHDEARRLSAQHLKLQHENRLRIAKNAQTVKEHEVHDLEKDVAVLESDFRRSEDDLLRANEELRRMSVVSGSSFTSSEEAQRGIHESEQQMARERDALKKMEHELEELNEHVQEKEFAIAEIKHKIAKLSKAHEDFRKKHDLEASDTKTTAEHVHKKKVELELVEQDKKRKEDALAAKRIRLADANKELRLKEDEVMDIEAELRRLNARD